MTATNWRERLLALDTGLVSDALDRLALKGATYGIRPVFPSSKIAGRVQTVHTTPAGRTTSQHHLGMRTISAAEPGDVIVVDSGGRIDVSSWGDILSTASKLKGLSGVVVDGACRDVDGCQAVGFPLYARGVVPMTARNRIVEDAFNVPVQCGGVAVHPGDWLIADGSGVVFIPQDRVEEVIGVAEELAAAEQKMLASLKEGMAVLQVDQQSGYEQMLKRE
jgi:regulator of RNase E activity RraA